MKIYKYQRFLIEDATSKYFLVKLDLPCLKQIDQDDLEVALGVDEQHRPVKCLNKGKSPDLGLPPELYVELWDMVGTLILDSFNFAIKNGIFHRDQKQHSSPYY